MALYVLNDEFLNSLYDRIQASIKEAIEEWKSDIRANTFLYNVVALGLPRVLSKEVLAEIVQTCLLASLEREEGELRPFSVALEPLNPDEFQSHYKFENDIDFTPTKLVKLATALDPNDYHIGVWPDNTLKIWGFKPRLFWFLAITSISPGSILLSCLSGSNAAFKCLISLPQTGFLNPLSSGANPVFGWLGEQAILTRIHKISDLGIVLSRMQHGGHGGAILLVKEKQSNWRESIERPLLYDTASYIPGYQYPEIGNKYEVIDEFESSVRQKESDPTKMADLKGRLSLALEKGKRSLEAIYNLTRIDNAVILSDNLRVLAFGARIVAQMEIEKIVLSEPFEGSTTEEVEFARWNVGNRHKSAAKFVREQTDCLALIVSEDRRISLFSWDENLNTVRQLRSFEAVILG